MLYQESFQNSYPKKCVSIFSTRFEHVFSSHMIMQMLFNAIFNIYLLENLRLSRKKRFENELFGHVQSLVYIVAYY